MFLKKSICSAIALSMMASSTSVLADANSAFESLLSSGGAATVSSGGRYQAAGRNIYTAGGIEARFPSQSLTLFSFQPPSFKAGCGGISAHFGGFSFINGDNIKTMIDNIGRGAVGFVVSLVIMAICPQCEAIINVMKKLARDAAALAIDSCQAAEFLVGKAADSLGVSGTKTQQNSKIKQICGVNVADPGAGGGPDMLKALGEVCNETEKAFKEIEKSVKSVIDDVLAKNGDNSPKGINEALDENELSNKTWATLASLGMNPVATSSLATPIPGVSGPIFRDLGDMILLQSIIGAPSTIEEEDPANPGQKKRKIVTVSNSLEPRTAISLFVCGKNKFDKQVALQQLGITQGDKSKEDYETLVKDTYGAGLSFCEASTSVKFTGNSASMADIQVIACADDNFDFVKPVSTSVNKDQNPYVTCLNPVAVPIGELGDNVIRAEGFYQRAVQAMIRGVIDIRENRPLNAETINLINASSLPIYQVMNLAAVYPVAGGQLIATTAFRFSINLAFKRLEFSIKKMRELGANSKSQLSSERLAEFYKILNDVREQASVINTRLYDSFIQEQALYDQIRSLNRAVQQNVVATELLSNQRYAMGINNTLNQQQQLQQNNPTTP